MDTTTQTAAVEDGGAKQAPVLPPFTVANRSRAQRIAKLVYGPQGRVWLNRDVNTKVSDDTYVRAIGVRVGVEIQGKAQFYVGGKDFTEALKQVAEEYLAGAPSYADVKKRIRALDIAGAQNLGTIGEEALKRFPEEYEKELAALKKKNENPLIARLQKYVQAAEAMKPAPSPVITGR